MKTDCVLLVGHTTSGQSPPPLRNKKIDHDLLCVSLGGPYNIVTQMIFFFEKDKIKSEKMRTFQNGFQSRHCHRPHFDGTKWFHQVGGEKEENAKWIPCCCNNVHPPHHRNRRMKCKSMAITHKKRCTRWSNGCGLTISRCKRKHTKWNLWVNHKKTCHLNLVAFKKL